MIVATETDRGLFVGAMVAAGYQGVGDQPDVGPAIGNGTRRRAPSRIPVTRWVLAEMARIDGHNHRPIAGDTELAEAVKVLARAHQTLIWTRQRQTNQLRSTLREFYPAALEAFDDLATATRWPCWPSPRHRPWAGACRDRRSPPRCGEAAGNAASTNEPPRSRPRCAPSISKHPHWSPTRWAPPSPRSSAVIAETRHPDRPARDRAGRPF